MDLQIFLNADDEDPVVNDFITILGETYDVMVDINYANPIDLKFVKVDQPAIARFAIKNRGNYEIKYTLVMNFVSLE